MGIHSSKCGGSALAILKLEALICSIVANIIRVFNVELNLETTFLQSR
jgi:hypothetical protein